MIDRTSRPLEVERDVDDDMFVRQYNGRELDVIVMNPGTALALACKLVSFAKGQGPREEIVEVVRK